MTGSEWANMFVVIISLRAQCQQGNVWPCPHKVRAVAAGVQDGSKYPGATRAQAYSRKG